MANRLSVADQAPPPPTPDHGLLSRFEAAFRRSAGQTPDTAVFHLGDHPVEVLSASAELLQVLGPSIAGLGTSGPAASSMAPMRLHLWAGAANVPDCPALIEECRGHPDRITVINDGDLHVQFNPEGSILSLVDCTRRVAYYHVPDPRHLPDYEVCTPFRMILNWLCHLAGLHLVHAAAVGVDGRGVLLAGHSGAGKSTTALSALLHRLEFAGDDYVAVSIAERISAFALYHGCKLTDDGLQRLPAMRRWLIETNRSLAKNVAVLDHDAGALVPRLDLLGIVRPVVAGLPASRLERVGAMTILSELGTSTVMQMPGAGAQILRATAELCRRLPTWRLHMSESPGEVAATLKAFIQTLEARTS